MITQIPIWFFFLLLTYLFIGQITKIPTLLLGSLIDTLPESPDEIISSDYVSHVSYPLIIIQCYTHVNCPQFHTYSWCVSNGHAFPIIYTPPPLPLMHFPIFFRYTYLFHCNHVMYIVNLLTYMVYIYSNYIVCNDAASITLLGVGLAPQGPKRWSIIIIIII